MRILLDENVPRQLIEALRRNGHDVLSILESNPGLPDSEVLNMAIATGRLLVTFDKEFASVVAVHKPSKFAGIVLLRLPMGGVDWLTDKVVDLLSHWHHTDNCVTIVKRDSVRIRRITPKT